MTTNSPTFTRLPNSDIPPDHPAHALHPHAYQCSICKGISFHPAEPESCPYCDYRDDD